MTERTQREKWIILLFFSAVILLFSYLVYVLVMNKTDPAFDRWMQRWRPEGAAADAPAPPPEDPFLFVRRRPKIADGLKITFRGARNGVVAFDLIILDLDPAYAYRRRIPLKEARRGFQLGDRRFRIERMEGGAVRLEPDPD